MYCGNNNFITTSHNLLSGNTQSCGCLKSKGEEKIKLILQQHNIIYEQEKRKLQQTCKSSEEYEEKIKQLAKKLKI